jgi:hypothetical protein
MFSPQGDEPVYHQVSALTQVTVSLAEAIMIEGETSGFERESGPGELHSKTI